MWEWQACPQAPLDLVPSMIYVYWVSSKYFQLLKKLCSVQGNVTYIHLDVRRVTINAPTTSWRDIKTRSTTYKGDTHNSFIGKIDVTEIEKLLWISDADGVWSSRGYIKCIWLNRFNCTVTVHCICDVCHPCITKIINTMMTYVENKTTR